MAVQLLQLLPHVLLDVLKSVKKRRSHRRGAGGLENAPAQTFFAGVHQSAVRMIDHHDLFGSQQVVRHQQRPQRIVGDDSSALRMMCASPVFSPSVRIDNLVSMQVNTASFFFGRGVNSRNSCVRE